MRTRKSRGGDINRNRAYKNIISIGYEFETADITKLTVRDDLDTKGKSARIMMNTDTARGDLNWLMKDIDETSDEYEDMIARQDELLELDAYNTSGKKDADMKFLVTNDISESALTKHIIELWGDTENYEDYDKNARFQLQTDDTLYPVSFVNTENIIGFTNVEWIMTYYKPRMHKNIILETFFNTVANLLHHVNQLNEVPATLHFIDKDENNITIDSPTERKLYHLPTTNMHYLQTHITSDPTPQSILDIRVTPQMTFSTKIEHVYGILKAMASDRFVSNEKLQSYNPVVTLWLDKINTCIDELLGEYNKQYTPKITLNKPQLQELRGYMFLLLWKLYIYYNRWIGLAEKRYFKDTNIFNVRHYNYDFYVAMKRLFINNMQLAEADAVQLILRLFLQPAVMQEYMLGSKTKLRRGVFSPNNHLDRENGNYGDPAYSLLSYFHFFEKPAYKDNVVVENKDGDEDGEYGNEKEDGENDAEEEEENEESYGGQPEKFITHEWLHYANIDAYSSKMEYANGTVLVEIRNFNMALLAYVYHIANERLTLNLKDTRKKISLRQLQHAFLLYKRIKGIRRGNTRKSIRK